MLPPDLRYVALGDSLAGGLHSYVPAYARLIEARTEASLHVDNRARNGWTSAQILAQVTRDRALRDAIAAADIVTVNAGGNDLLPARVQFELVGDPDCIAVAVERFAERFAALLDEIVGLRASAHGIVTMDLYQPFVAAEIQVGAFEVMAAHVADANSRIRAAAGSHGIPVARVHATLNGPDGRTDAARAGLLWFDGIHPSAAGAEAIAGALCDVTGERVPA